MASGNSWLGLKEEVTLKDTSLCSRTTQDTRTFIFPITLKDY